MIIDNLNLNNLRIFQYVYKSRSMTVAARQLHLTQSGVSQHMKALEEVLGVKLFDRVRQRLIPTAAGTTLASTCAAALDGIENGLADIKGDKKQLSGVVHIGTPIEFGNNILMPLLAKFCVKHPRVNFGLRYGFVTEMYEGILKGDLDFSFVDAFASDRRIATEKVYDEVLYLCAKPECVKRAGPDRDERKHFEALEYVDYQEGEPLSRMWFKHHYGFKDLRLNVRATVMDVQGVARLILTGLAAGVLPGHLVAKLEKEGHKLHKFKGCGKPLKNSISVAYLRERTPSAAAAAVLKALHESTMI